MNAEQPQDQQRRSHRFVVGANVQGELVLANRSRWPVHLLDQSAGGFAVLTDGPTPIAHGDTAQLQTDSFCSQVRVVYSNEVVPGEGDGGESMPRFRLGLMRLGDLGMPSDDHESGSGWLPWRLSRPGNNRAQIILFLCILAIPVIAIMIIGTFLSSRSLRNYVVHSRTDGDYTVDPLQRNGNASPGSAEAQGESAGTRGQGSAQLESRLDDLKYLPGAAPFVTTGVIRDLQLTDDQLERIRGILDETDKVIAENEDYRKLFDLGRREVLNLLTDQQRRRWENLIGGGRLRTGKS